MKHCDQILVVARGRVLERGTHEELLQRRAAYHKLWTTQTGARK